MTAISQLRRLTINTIILVILSCSGIYCVPNLFSQNTSARRRKHFSIIHFRSEENTLVIRSASHCVRRCVPASNVPIRSPDLFKHHMKINNGMWNVHTTSNYQLTEFVSHACLTDFRYRTKIQALCVTKCAWRRNSAQSGGEIHCKVRLISLLSVHWELDNHRMLRMQIADGLSADIKVKYIRKSAIETITSDIGAWMKTLRHR